MNLKHLITQFTYRIESKPDGGFIAHASDPAVPPLEAPTRLELQQKIQATIAAGLAAQFPALKLSPEGNGLNFAFHIESKPGGGFTLHSADPQAQTIEAASHQEIESHFAEKLMKFAGRHLAPQLAQALAAKGGSGDIKISVNTRTGFSATAGSHTLSVGVAKALAGSQLPDAKIQGAQTMEITSGGDLTSNSPITPESSGNSKLFLFLLLVAVAGAIIYLLFHR